LGCTSEASLSGNNGPQTPPYTPHRNKGKRRLERSDSPASVASVHPAETSSPAKKAARCAETDEVKVEELAEGDAGYHADMDVILPEELEEISSSDGDDEIGSDMAGDPSDARAGSISSRLSRLRCDDEDEEAKFEQGRRLRRLSKRMGSRVFKRSHSQSVNSDGGVTDADAMPDHDLPASQRRLRRRTRGPEGDAAFGDIPTSPAGAASLRGSVPPRSRPTTPAHDANVPDAKATDEMEVDDAG